tara:strand:- start:34 stop:756 length:723 start_codon:yes stop_codon:yes gene_type:complete
MKNLIIFGDSWSYGFRETNELVELLKQGKHTLGMSIKKGTAYRIEDRYSKLVAKQYGSDIIDFSRPGLSNREMSYLLMDAIIKNKLNPKTDFVIVILTTWARIFPFMKKLVNYDNMSTEKIADPDWVAPDEPEWFEKKNLDLEELAYAQFVDYNFITNLLELNKFQYVIGWNWNKPKEFCKYLSYEYEKNIISNDKFLNCSFEEFFIDWNEPFRRHPNEDEHKLYAEYLIDKIKPHNDRM